MLEKSIARHILHVRVIELKSFAFSFLTWGKLNSKMFLVAAKYPSTFTRIFFSLQTNYRDCVRLFPESEPLSKESVFFRAGGW